MRAFLHSKRQKRPLDSEPHAILPKSPSPKISLGGWGCAPPGKNAGVPRAAVGRPGSGVRGSAPVDEAWIIPSPRDLPVAGRSDDSRAPSSSRQGHGTSHVRRRDSHLPRPTLEKDLLGKGLRTEAPRPHWPAARPRCYIVPFPGHLHTVLSPDDVRARSRSSEDVPSRAPLPGAPGWRARRLKHTVVGCWLLEPCRCWRLSASCSPAGAGPRPGPALPQAVARTGRSRGVARARDSSASASRYNERHQQRRGQ